MTTTHIAGTFLIHADGAFLNGAGLGDGENRNVTVPKTLKDQNNTVPYVSSQAWKRWLRNTAVEENGWEASELVASKLSSKQTTSKIEGKLDPIGFPEDDLFGYMRAQEGQGKAKAELGVDDSDDEEEAEGEAPSKKAKTKAIVRASPFSASLLVSIRKKGWRGRDEGFVHLKEGTPLPYTTEFYTTHLQGIFILAHNRVCRFENSGDRVELDEAKAKKYVADGKLTKVGEAYEIANAAEERKARSGALLKSLAVLRGGAKQAAFGTDVAPKLLILAGLSCGNPIFNHLFEESDSAGLTLNITTFQEVIKDYADRITTPVFIGLRSGYVANEREIRALEGVHQLERGQVEVKISTPRSAAEQMAELL